MSAVITTWSNLIDTDGKTVEAPTWDPLFDGFIAAGQNPFRGKNEHPGWSPTRMDPPQRADVNVLGVTALVIDYDGGELLSAGVEMWHPFYGLIHTTRRHRAEEHRYRTIMPLAREVTRAEYGTLWNFVVHTSGHKVDPSTKNPSRFWYMPGVMEGGAFQAQRLHGAVMDPDVLLQAAAELAAQQVPPSNVTQLRPGESRETRYAARAFADECNKVGMAAPGQRNNLLFQAAATAGNFIAIGALGESEAWGRLEQAAQVCGLPRFEARRTIQSGIARGKLSPRQVPEPTRSYAASSGAPSERPAKEPALAREPTPTPSAPAPHPLDERWKTVGERASLQHEPPPRKWLLMRPDEETNGRGNPLGVLPLGKTGLLVAQGGSGKTIALIQLAIAVATGRRWLDYFHVPKPGRVVLALAEEDDEELDRRIHDLARGMRLTDAQMHLVEQNVVALALSGVVTALVAQDGKSTVETEVLAYFRRRLGESEWALIVLDTLTRFAGGDTEKDAAQATRFIQSVESLCKVPGSPTVLVAHHTNKISRAEGATTSAANSRGSSALTDGARWVANLDALSDESVKLTITKSNYAKAGAPVMLLRDPSNSGCLSVENPALARARAEEAAAKAAQERFAHVRASILAAIESHPELAFRDEVARAVGGRRQDVLSVLRELMERGDVSLVEGKFAAVKSVKKGAS
jgi:hypothetical protein